MSRIYVFRDHKVMLDRDLAELYGVETKQLKRQVRRNIDRFPLIMYTKLKYLIYFSLTALACIGCSKDDNGENAVVSFENTTWVATTTDENPRTNPPGTFGMNGTNQYYPWSECHMDDSFIFLKDQLSINDNGTVCEDGLDLIFDTKNQPYSYNAETKTLTVGSGDDVAVLDVYELNKDRLKLGLTISTGTGIGHLVLLFKKK